MSQADRGAQNSARVSRRAERIQALGPTPSVSHGVILREVELEAKELGLAFEKSVGWNFSCSSSNQALC